MFWRAVGFVVVMFGFVAWGLAQHRWTEHMLARVNQTRPPDKQLRSWGVSSFSLFDLHEEFWRVDPKGYPRAMLGFLLSGLILVGLALWLTGGFDAEVSTREQPRRWVN